MTQAARRAENAFVFSPNQQQENIFLSAVNHLALGQVETAIALRRSAAALCSRVADVNSPTTAAVDTTLSAAELIHDVLQSLLTQRFAGHRNDTTSAMAGVVLSPSFRVCASSIAPCLESLLFALATNPQVNENLSIWWDEEMVVLVNMLVHTAGNLLHAHISPGDFTGGLDGSSQQRNVAVMRNELLSSLDFILEHDPDEFGTIDFLKFVNVVVKFDTLFRAASVREEKEVRPADPVSPSNASLPHEDLVRSMFDDVMRSLWALTRCFVSQESFALYFESAVREWRRLEDSGAAQSNIEHFCNDASYYLSPYMVARILSIFYPQPPTASDAANSSALRKELLAQWREDAKRAGGKHVPITFMRASYLKATEKKPEASHTNDAADKKPTVDPGDPISFLPSSLFCYPICCLDGGSFRRHLLDLFTTHTALHRFVEAFCEYSRTHLQASSTSLDILRSAVPVHDREAMFRYTSVLLLADGQKRDEEEAVPRDALSRILSSVVDYLINGVSHAPSQRLQAPPSQSFLSVVRSYFPSRVLQSLKPFVLFELYGRRGTRARFLESRLALSLQDHDLLVDYLTSADEVEGSSSQRLPVSHPCYQFLEGLKLTLKLALIVEKQQVDSSGGGNSATAKLSGHELFLRLIDSQCDVIDLCTPTTTPAPGEQQRSAIKALLVVRNPGQLFATLISLFTSALQDSKLSRTFSTSLRRQILLMRAVAVLHELVQEEGFTDSGIRAWAATVQRFAESATALSETNTTLGASQGAASFVQEVAESLVEIVLSLAAKASLLPLLSDDTNSDRRSTTASLLSSPSKSSRSLTAGSPAPTASSAGDCNVEAFCAVVSCLKAHVGALLSDETKCLLKDVSFRASRSSEATCGATSVNAFARSPFRFLLEAALAPEESISTRTEEVLLNLFQFEQNGPSLVKDIHPALMFSFVSTRLSALRRGTLSMSAFQSHMDLISKLLLDADGSAVNSSRQTSVMLLLRLEELWFHNPVEMERLLASDSTFTRKYQQSVLQDLSSGTGAGDVRVASRRFEEAVASVHPPQQAAATTSSTSSQIFLKYLSATTNVRCSTAIFESFLRNMDRLSRMASSSSTTIEDLDPLLTQLSMHLDSDPSLFFTQVFDGVQDRSVTALPLVMDRMKELIQLVRLCGEGKSVSLPLVVQQGHRMLFRGAVDGSLEVGLERISVLSNKQKPLSPGSVALLLRILLTEFSACRAVPSDALGADEELRFFSVLCEVTGSVSVGLISMHLFGQRKTLDLMYEAAAKAPDGLGGEMASCDAESKKRILRWGNARRQCGWLFEWLSANDTLLRSFDSTDEQSCGSLRNLRNSPLLKCRFYCQPEYRVEVLVSQLLYLYDGADWNESCAATVVVGVRNRRSYDYSVLRICEVLPTSLLLLALRTIPNSQTQRGIRDDMIDIVISHMMLLKTRSLQPASGTVAAPSVQKLLEFVEGAMLQETDNVAAAAYFVVTIPAYGGRLCKAVATLPNRLQRRVLENILRRLVVENHFDADDAEAIKLSRDIEERLARLSQCTELQDSVQKLCDALSRSGGEASVSPSTGLALLLSDPVPLELIAAQFKAIDDDLRQLCDAAIISTPTTPSELLSNGAAVRSRKKEALDTRTRFLSLVRTAVTSEVAMKEVVTCLAGRYSEYLRLLREEAIAAGSERRADLLLLKELSVLIKDELPASLRHANTSDAQQTMQLGTSPAASANLLIHTLVEELILAPEFSRAMVLRIVRFVRESTMTRALFAEQKWNLTALGLHALTSLESFGDRIDVEERVIDEVRGGGSAAATSRRGSKTTPSSNSTPTGSSAPTLQAPNDYCYMFDRTFNSAPLLVLENLLMSERVSAAAVLVESLRLYDKDNLVANDIDELILVYAKKAADVAAIDGIAEDMFPYGKRLTEDVPKLAELTSACPFTAEPFELRILPSQSSTIQKTTRESFTYRKVPCVPMFRRLVQLCSNRQLTSDRLLSFASKLFESIGEYESNVAKSLVIDTAEKVLQSIPNPNEESNRLLHWLEISRHLVVCRWREHPRLKDLESSEGIMQLVTNLLDEGHNKGAFSIAEVCHLDLRVIQSVWARRTTNLLHLGMFDEAATTLGHLPTDRAKEILSEVLETIEGTPMPMGIRSQSQHGNYSVKATPSVFNPDGSLQPQEVQAMATLRRNGVRLLLTRFGSSADLLAFYVRAADFAQALPLALQFKKDDDVLIRDLYLPVEDSGTAASLRKAMLAYDPSLERLRPILFAICKHLEGREEYVDLLAWQELMCDYARAAQTSILLATSAAESSLAQRTAYVQKAEKFLVESKFQPLAKSQAAANAPCTDEGILLPPTRLDGQQLNKLLVQCRLQKDLWAQLHHDNHLPDPLKFSVFGDESELAEMMTALIGFGKAYFELSFKVLTSLGINVQFVFAPATVQLLRLKKHDVVEHLCDFIKKTVVVGPSERNAIAYEIIKGSHSEFLANSAFSKRAGKLVEYALESMTSEGGFKARALMLLKRWVDAMNESFACKDKQVVLDLYDAVSKADADEEVTHVINSTRQFLARNALRM